MSLVLDNRRPVSRYRPPQRVPAPLPPRWAGRERDVERHPFAQFILLSMLLHALAIALFGAPSGGSRDGRAVWGELTVMLQGSRQDAQLATAGPPATAPPHEAKVVPPPPPAPSSPVVLPAPSPASSGPVADVMPQLLDRLPPIEPRLEPPPLLVPAPTQVQVAPTPPPAPPIAVEALPVEQPALRQWAAPTLLEAPRVALPQPELAPRALAEPPPIAAAPAMPAPPPVSIAAPRIEPLARPVDRVLMQELPLAARTPTALERALAREPEILRAPAAADMPATSVPRSPESTSPFGPRADGPPTASARDFPRGGDQPRDYDPTAGGPALDADAVRRRAGQLAREGTGNRALLPFPMPSVAPPKSRVETALEKARKPDCRDAYKHFGLAAIVPLLANEFGEGTCRW
ncbi:MAG TPA: hypothetical protein VEC19_15900 [Usitatibacter sp.]|nr:hypothetical protein [Usitatibacter sp.]